MAPIRVGIIGLSAKEAGTEGYVSGTWGLVHLAALTDSPHYEITALCNSSEEKARQSIAFHGLGGNVAAYGSPEELARDPNVDLITVTVGIGKHVELTKPALLNGKDVMIEFPIAPTVSEVEELHRLATQHKVRVIVGAQARSDAAFERVRKLIQSGSIGTVVATNWTGHSAAAAWRGWPEALKGFLDKDGGANMVTIGLGHALAAFIGSVGSFARVQSVLKTRGRTASLLGADGNVTNPAYEVTVPDTMFIQGVLENGAIASFTLRPSPESVDGEGIRWTVTGTEGEIQLTNETGFVQMPSSGTKLKIRKQGQETQDIDVNEADEPEHVRKQPVHVINTARLYEAFYAKKTDEYPSLEEGLAIHRLLHEIETGGIWAP